VETQRINRFLADRGLGSRRFVEKLVAAGKVSLNGAVLTDLSYRVQVGVDEIKVEGEVIGSPLAERSTWLFHKPAGCLCTRNDPKGRPTIWDYCPHLPPPFQAVGRLDFDSSGLLLITSDGDLAQRLMHPSFEVSKIYEVRARGPWSEQKEQALKAGVEMEEGGIGKAETLRASWVDKGKVVDLRLLLRRGKKREIRYSLGALGMEVSRLHRVQLGELKLGELKKSSSRQLEADDLSLLEKVMSELK
jgi:23S rRNA pseudouridine2605 synthase